MNRRRQCLQSWFAGLFDGEGTVGVYKYDSDPYYKAVVNIQMDDPVGPLLIHKEYPESVTWSSLSNTGQRFWRVTFNGTKAYDFLKAIKPFSVTKHQQVLLTLAFLASQRRWKAGDRTKDDHNAYAEKVAAKLVLLKRENNGVNSVNALLTHEMREYRAKRDEVEDDVSFLLSKV